MKKNNKIQSKLTRTFCAVVAAALLVSNLSVYLYLRQIYNRELVNNYRNIGENISEQLENDLANIENFARLVCLDKNLQDLMRNHLKCEGYMYYRTIREITSALAQYVALRDDLIDDIYIVDRENTVISRNGFYQDTPESDWYRKFTQQDENFAFSGVHKVNSRETNLADERKEVISYVVGMFDLTQAAKESGRMGYVVFNIKYAALMSEMDSFPEFRGMLVEKDGDVIGGTDEKWKIETISPQLLDSDNRINGSYYFSSEIPTAGWVLISTVEASVLNMQMLHVAALSFGIMLLIMFCAGWVVAVLARNITGPLQLLTTGIRQFSEGNYETHVEVKSGDEVEKVADVFNRMADSIKLQMEENRRKEMEKCKSQLRFLMAQIKPHFIYNSLNCIIYLARREKTEDIIRFTKAFISLLQAAVRTEPQQENELAVEVNYLKNYITLIRYRYENAMEFGWTIEEGCASIQVPALILQPIVENSVFHGLLPNGTPGHIHLSVAREGERVKVKIEDDGCGISDGQLKQIRAELEDPNLRSPENDHVGLENISERLKLCYGPECRLHIDSRLGIGTEVWFCLPVCPPLSREDHALPE